MAGIEERKEPVHSKGMETLFKIIITRISADSGKESLKTRPRNWNNQTTTKTRNIPMGIPRYM